LSVIENTTGINANFAVAVPLHRLVIASFNERLIIVPFPVQLCAVAYIGALSGSYDFADWSIALSAFFRQSLCAAVQTAL
jgi:hypothetical protein